MGTGAVFGLREDTHMTGREYSLLGSIAPIAQLGWQPFSAWLIVKVPHRILMPSMILGWGIAETFTCLCHDFKSMMACRFFLGLFEAGCLPLFAIMTGQWYRRVEQPLRVSIWYSMNGTATMAAAALSYGLGHIKSEKLYSWQMSVILAHYHYHHTDSLAAFTCFADYLLLLPHPSVTISSTTISPRPASSLLWNGYRALNVSAPTSLAMKRFMNSSGPRFGKRLLTLRPGCGLC